MLTQNSKVATTPPEFKKTTGKITMNLIKNIVIATFSITASILLTEWLHIGDERYSKIDSNEFISEDGEVRYIPGARGSIPFLKIKSTTQEISIACPRSTKNIPCNDPPRMQNFLTGSIGHVEFRKYKTQTIASGSGEVVVIKMQNGNHASEDRQRVRHESTIVIVKTILSLVFSVFYFFSSIN